MFNRIISFLFLTLTLSTNVLAFGTDGCFNKSVFLMHMDGSDTSTSFTDEDCAGTGKKIITASGNAQLDNSIVKFGTAAGLFDGVGDFITTPDSADFTVGNGDWTVDCWFNRAGGDLTFRVLCGQSDVAATDASRTIEMRLTSANVLEGVTIGATVTGTTAISTTGWHHAAFVRTGDILRLFLDGVQEGGDVARTTPINDSSADYGVGQLGQFGLVWNGSIDEFRFTNGVALWTKNFTPPSTPYCSGCEMVGAFD